MSEYNDYYFWPRDPWIEWCKRHPKHGRCDVCSTPLEAWGCTHNDGTDKTYGVCLVGHGLNCFKCDPDPAGFFK